MKIKFWGVWGSLPNSIKESTIRKKLETALAGAISNNVKKENITEYIEKLPAAVNSTYGGNTSCVEVLGGEEYMICDAGSGIRDLATDLMAKGTLFQTNAVKTFNIFMSHLHWDHTQGFPFFIPAYIPGVKINFYGCHKELEHAYRIQQESIHFPVRLNEMKSDITFNVIDTDKEYKIGGMKVTAKLQNHPGDSFCYKFEKDGKTFIYATDSEHTPDYDRKTYEFLDFFKEADALVFDAMYAHIEAVDTKQNWGHSSNMTGVEIAADAKVKNLFLFHHDNKFDDFGLEGFLEESVKYLKIYDENAETNVHMSREGMCFEL